MKKAASQPPFCLRDLDILLADVAPGRTQAARALRAGAHSTLHGVVFAILCLGSAVYRRRGAALRPGHEIVSASRSRRIDPTPMHHALARTRNLARQPLDSGFAALRRPGMTVKEAWQLTYPCRHSGRHRRCAA